MTKCKFRLQLIPLVITNFFSLEVVQKRQHCQLCVLPENSFTFDDLQEEGVAPVV